MHLNFKSFKIDNKMKPLSKQEYLPLSTYFKNKKDKIPGKAGWRMAHKKTFSTLAGSAYYKIKEWKNVITKVLVSIANKK